MNSLFNTLLLHLSTNKYITATELGEKALVSSKTVRNYITDLSKYLEQYGATIERKHGYGFKLIIKDEKLFSTIYSSGQASLTREDDYIPQNSEERGNYIISRLVDDNEVVVDELLDHLCISEYTLQSDLTRIKKTLELYNLKLVGKSGKIHIEGSELEKRTFFVSCSSLLKQDDLMKQEISRMFLKVLHKYDISMSEISIENMIMHLYYSVKRIKENQTVDHMPDMKFESDDLSLMIAQEICKLLSEKYDVYFSDYEVSTICLHLFGHRVTEKYGVGNANIVISQDIYNLVLDIAQFIQASMKIDLRKNLGLLMKLSVHLVSLEIRIKYNIHLRNPLLGDIKKKYALGYTMALQTKRCIEEHYKCQLNEDELGYLAVIFEVQLRQDKKQRKNNILIVCCTGKTTSELLAYQYRELFGSYLNKIETCNISELAERDFSEVDYILTTTPIHIAVPVPIVQVKMFLSDEEELELKEVFKNNTIKDDNFYKRQLFFTGLKSKSKNDAIYELCNKVKKVIDLPEGFAESVINRESMGSTDFGEMVALAHSYGLSTDQTFVSVGILDEPIFWGKNDVQIIFLISVSDDSENGLADMYREIGVFMLDKQKSKKLISEPTFDTFITLLKGK